MVVGKVALVGAGPGDPELLTLKALRLLQQAEVVVFDRLVSPAILDFIPADASRIYVGKALNHHHLAQSEINALLVSLARTGRFVVRLKGGDPFVFGRGSEEAEHLVRHLIPFEIVPGITSASGGCTYAGIPLTHRGYASGVRYITGHGSDNRDIEHDWAALADPNTTLVIYMGLTNLERIFGRLMTAGLPPDTPAAAVENATTPRQRRLVGTIASLPGQAAEAGLTPPTIIVVGKVVALAGVLDWYAPGGETEPDRLPLARSRDKMRMRTACRVGAASGCAEDQ